ncbi:hypothetical protein [Clostridioides difficile]|nr:hypothetical protein [Clostridioides difficile]UUV16737.1 hypothetical protein NQ183_19915 [Clostridioides difficile]
MSSIKNSNLKFEEDKVDKLLDKDKSDIKYIRWIVRIIHFEDGKYKLIMY